MLETICTLKKERFQQGGSVLLAMGLLLESGVVGGKPTRFS
jgi:hypothetical protein